MSKIIIKLGMPQPEACPHCKTFSGYQYMETLRIRYTTLYTADGSRDGGFYGDSARTITSHKTAYCANCGKKLTFKIQ